MTSGRKKSYYKSKKRHKIFNDDGSVVLRKYVRSGKYKGRYAKSKKKIADGKKALFKFLPFHSK